MFAVRGRDLVEMRFAQAVYHIRYIFIGRMHGLKVLKGVDRFRILLVQIIGFADFELRVGKLRAERKIGFNFTKGIDGAHIFLFVEIVHSLVE